MECTFCRRKLSRQLFTCDSHSQVIACTGCRDYDCYRCKAELRKVLHQFCNGCKQYRLASKSFGTQYSHFCLDCCLKAYKNSQNSKKVVLCKFINEPDKYQIYRFLKKYCYHCQKNLTSERPEDIDSGLREIYPLEINLCSKCSSSDLQKENKVIKQEERTEKVHNFQGLKSKQLNDLKSTIKTEVIKTKQEKRFEETKPFHHARQPQRKSQNSEFLRCQACDHLVLGEGIINDDIVICKYCIKWSNMEQNEIQLKNSRQVRRSGFNNGDSSYTRQSEAQSRYNNPSQSHKNHQNNFSDQKYGLKTQQEKMPLHNLNGNRNSERSTNPSENISRLRNKEQQPKPEKISSEEERMINVPISVKYVEDSELVECSKCGIRMEVDSSIWEETLNKPICRCCFTQMLEQIQKERQRYEPQQRSQVRSTSPIVKSYLRPEKVKSGLEVKQKEKKEPKKELSNQPIIEQESESRSNKVKRAQSWDESIVVEPVEDHQRRKKQKQKQRENQIIEEENEDQAKQSREINTEPNIVENKADKKSQSHDKQQQTQPTIVEESPESKRVRKMQSWDQQIVLQPVADLLQRKQTQKASKSPIKEEPKKQELNRQYKKQQQQQKPEPKAPNTKDQRSPVSQDEWDKKYKQTKERLQRQIDKGFSNISGASGHKPGNGLGDSRSTTYSNYYKQQLKSGNHPPGISSIHQPKPQPKPENSYYSPYQRAEDNSTYYSASSSRSREYYDPRPPSSLRYPVYPDHGRSEKQGLTGYRALDRKQIKICQLCHIRFETNFKDYFVRGYNACMWCYESYISKVR